MDLAKKVVIEYYYWDVQSDREGYVLENRFEKNIDDEIGSLIVCCSKIAAGPVLSKQCKKNECDKYVDYVKNYINQYP